jgi:vacuolar protein sorting-associated protein 26
MKGKNVEHSGVRIECVGIVEHLQDPNRNSTFLQLWKDVEPPGNLTENSNYDFEFLRCEKLHESYHGTIVRVRYYINVVINRSYQKINKEAEFIVQNITPEPENNKSLMMKMGLQEGMQVSMELACVKYHLNDCILAKVQFHRLSDRIKIKLIELTLIRRETVGTGVN